MPTGIPVIIQIKVDFAQERRDGSPEPIVESIDRVSVFKLLSLG
jgi:hypothetical protein